jgi:hypothetical protein
LGHRLCLDLDQGVHTYRRVVVDDTCEENE